MRLERGVEVPPAESAATPASQKHTSHALNFPGGAGAEDGQTLSSTTVDVRVSAEAEQLSVLRAIVGDLAMRADFDVDTIADLRLAVDEACSALVRLAAPGAELRCRFDTGTTGLTIHTAVTSNNESGPKTTTFGWRVLSTLADSVSTSVEPTGAGKFLVRIDLTKGRATGEASGF